MQVYEVGVHEGRPYIALEFVPGGSLAEQLYRTLPSARQAAYRTLCGVPMTEAELAAIRYAVQTRVVDADGAARPLVSTT